MKLVKMLGLGMVAAIAAMAFVGASSASASNVVICGENVEPCPAGKILPAGAKITGSAVNPVLLGQSNEKCEKSSVTGELGAPGESLLAKVLSTTFTGNCTPCTTVTASATELHITHNPDGTYKVLVLKPKAVFTGCPLGASCTFAAEDITMTGTNTATGGVITAKEAELKRTAGSEFLCGNVGKWDAEYKVTGHWFSLA